MKKQKVKQNYINAEEFKSEVMKSKENGQCTERLGQLLIELHQHCLRMERYNKKPQDVKDEIMSFSIYRILKRGFETYDPEATAKKTFNYFSCAAITNMLRKLQDIEKKQKREVQYKDEILQSNIHNYIDGE